MCMKMFDKNPSLDKKKIKWSGEKKMLLLTGTVVQIRLMGEGNIK